MRLTRVLWVLIAFVVVVPSTQGETARDVIRPVVTKHEFDRFCKPLNLSIEQRFITQALFDDYSDTFDALVDEADRAAESAGRDRIEAAMSGRERLDSQTLSQLRADVLGAYRTALPEADALFHGLIDDVIASLVDEQVVIARENARQMRRSVLLHPRQRNEDRYEYAGDGVDILQLFELASRPGGALNGLEGSAVDQALDQYANALDSLLIARSLESRLNAMDARIARTAGDEDKAKAAAKASLDAWAALFSLNRRTADRVAQLASQSLGPQAAEAWLATYEQACFPWLFRPAKPDREHDWLSRQDLTAEQRSAIDATYRAYLDKRGELLGRMIDYILESRTDLGAIMYSMMDSTRLTTGEQRELYENMVRLSGELETLSTDTSTAFASALPEKVRKSMRRSVRR